MRSASHDWHGTCSPFSWDHLEGVRCMPGEKHQPTRYEKKHSKKADSRLMQERGEKRSGSESDAHSGRKRSRLHEDHSDQNRPRHDSEPDADFAYYLTTRQPARATHGPNTTLFRGHQKHDQV